MNYERKAQREISQKDLKELLTLMQIYKKFKEQRTFEWRFAFPEVLDENGNFKGFDLIIGNPPYIRQEELKDLKPALAKNYAVYEDTSDIYTYFMSLDTSF